MTTDEWLVGWKKIGKYLGKSARTAKRYVHEGMPFLRDPGGRPMAKPSMIDEYLVDLNRDNFQDKTWRDEGIDTALSYEDFREQQRKSFQERLLAAQKSPRGRFQGHGKL